MQSRTNANASWIGGLVLIGLGLVFLAGQLLNFDVWHYLWPFFFVGLGLLFFVGMFLSGKSAGGLAIPGSIITMLGLLFLYQNTFNHWASWAYAWTLLAPTSVGIGLMIYARWSAKPELEQPGWILTVIGVLMFLFMGTFFELFLGFGRYSVAGQFLWPLLFIALGVVLLARGLFRMIVLPRTSASLPAADSTRALPTNTTGGNT